MNYIQKFKLQAKQLPLTVLKEYANAQARALSQNEAISKLDFSV